MLTFHWHETQAATSTDETRLLLSQSSMWLTTDSWLLVWLVVIVLDHWHSTWLHLTHFMPVQYSCYYHQITPTVILPITEDIILINWWLMVHWFIHSSMINWLIDWFIHSLIHSFIHSSNLVFGGIPTNSLRGDSQLDLRHRRRIEG